MVNTAQVSASSTPHTPGGAGESSLPAGAVSYWNVRAAVTATVVVALGAVGSVWLPWSWLGTVFWYVVAPLVVIGLVADLAFLNRMQFRNFSYTVTPELVYVAQGLFIRKCMTVSTAQILNVEISHGPLLRRRGLVSSCPSSSCASSRSRRWRR